MLNSPVVGIGVVVGTGVVVGRIVVSGPVHKTVKITLLYLNGFVANTNII